MSDLVDFAKWIAKKKDELHPLFVVTLMKEIALYLNEPATPEEIKKFHDQDKSTIV